MIKREDIYYCDFCGKSQHEVAKVVAGPDSIGICDECVDLAVDIVDQESDAPSIRRDAERYRALREASNARMSHVRVMVTFEGDAKAKVATAEVVDRAVDLLVDKQNGTVK